MLKVTENAVRGRNVPPINEGPTAHEVGQGSVRGQHVLEVSAAGFKCIKFKYIKFQVYRELQHES